jgi:hypothetical protein
MNEKLKDKISKIQELINRGATYGETAAAKRALDRIIAAHGIDESELYSINFKTYTFKFGALIEFWLLGCIMNYFNENAVKSSYRVAGKKIVQASLLYEEWITVECAYEYFRRHMKKEYKRIVSPNLRKNTSVRRKKSLTGLFFNQYLIKSKLYKEGDLANVEIEDMSVREMRDRQMMQKIEGGKYNKQVMSNLLLTCSQ